MLKATSYTSALLIASIAFLLTPHAAQTETSESLVISGATIIDGSGRPGFRASLRIEGGSIAEVGPLSVRQGEEVVDGRGMILAPGFIDIHNHSDRGLDTDPGAATQVSQGITTIVIGADGGGPWPVGEYLSRRAESKGAVNLVTFIGHATVRQRVMGRDYKRPAREKEIGEMKLLVEQAMKEGAAGLSTGLEYDIGHPSTTEEVIELARVAARHGGIYMSHIRDEADLVLDALTEAIRIGREARIPVQVSHIKMGTVGVWGKSREAVALINRARKSGVDVTADCYPYTAWASTITVLVPSRRHDDPVAVGKGIDDVGGASKVLITRCAAHSDFEGLTLEEVARRKGISPVEAYIQIVKDGGASVVCNSMQETDVRVFYRQPWVMVASDGGIGLCT